MGHISYALKGTITIMAFKYIIFAIFTLLLGYLCKLLQLGYLKDMEDDNSHTGILQVHLKDISRKDGKISCFCEENESKD